VITFSAVPDSLKSKIPFWKIWLPEIARYYSREVDALNFQFCGNNEIIKANQKFLNHSYATDIITFGYKEGKNIAADILIGIETISENADHYQVAFEDELDRVLAHGILHLIGFNDYSKAEQAEMRAAEEKCLILRAQI